MSLEGLLRSVGNLSPYTQNFGFFCRYPLTDLGLSGLGGCRLNVELIEVDGQPVAPATANDAMPIASRNVTAREHASVEGKTRVAALPREREHHPGKNKRDTQKGEENGGSVLEPFLWGFFRGE